MWGNTRERRRCKLRQGHKGAGRAAAPCAVAMCPEALSKKTKSREKDDISWNQKTIPNQAGNKGDVTRGVCWKRRDYEVTGEDPRGALALIPETRMKEDVKCFLIGDIHYFDGKLRKKRRGSGKTKGKFAGVLKWIDLHILWKWSGPWDGHEVRIWGYFPIWKE